MPKGYGSVYKLRGPRNKPWAARVTIGTKLNMEKMTAVPEYSFIGFYKTKAEAMTALMDYHRNPYDLSHGETTFEECYNAWWERKYPTLKNTAPYTAAYKILEPIKGKKFSEITYGMMQNVFDRSGKNAPMLEFAKIIVTSVYKEAAKGSIVTNEVYERMKLLEVGNKNPDSRPHKRISAADLAKIWENKDDPSAQFALILIYTGCRISEILNLKPKQIDMEKKYFHIDDAKTPSGIREVPIADKIVPFFEEFLQKHTKYLTGNYSAYPTCMRNIWNPLMQALKLDYIPHDCRVTLISLLTEAGVDARIIKAIVGHKGSGVTEQVYTRISIEKKLEAINLI